MRNFIYLFFVILLFSSCNTVIINQRPIHYTVEVKYKDGSQDTINFSSENECDYLALDTDVFNNTVCLENCEFDIACNVVSFNVISKTGGGHEYLEWYWAILLGVVVIIVFRFLTMY